MPFSVTYEKAAFFSAIANTLFWLGVLILPTANSVFLASIFSSISCFYFFWKFLVEGNGFSDQLGFASLCLQLVLCFSFVFSSFFNLTFLNTSVEDLLWSMKISPLAYAIAVLFCMQSAILFAVFGFNSPVKEKQMLLAERIHSVAYHRTCMILVLGIMIFLFQAFFVLSGLIDVRRIGFGTESGLPWFVPIFEFSKSFSIPICALLAIQSFSVYQKKNKCSLICVLVLLLATNLFILFFSSRREFISSLFLFAIYFLFFNKNIQNRKWFAIFTIILSFFSIPILNAINGMRTLSGDELTSLQKIYYVFSNQIYKIKTDGFLVEEERENYAYRPLVLGIHASVMEMPPNTKDYLYGENLLNSFFWSLPSFIVPMKENLLVQENLLYESLPNMLFFTDQANSLNLEAYSDFGWFGPIVYVSFYSLIWYVSLLILLKIKSSVAVLAGFCIYPPFWCQSLAEGSTIGFLNVFRFFLICTFLIYISQPVFEIVKQSFQGRNFPR